MVRVTKDINLCVDEINKGGIVVFPTETVYGMGANIYNEASVNKIYDIKMRPKSKPLIVHVHNLNQIKELVDLSEDSFISLKNIITKLSPGPISFLLPKSKKVPEYVTGNLNKVCLRIPSNESALEFLKKVNVPICAPSANLYCHASPTCVEHIENDFKNTDILILEDLYQDTVIGIESTIVDINFETNMINILRPGFITPSMLCSIYPDFEYVYNKNPDIPGSSMKHYSINKNIQLVQSFSFIETLDKVSSSIVDFGSNFNNSGFLNYYSLSYDKNYIESMQRLYSVLRQCENDNSLNVYIYFPKISDENHFYTAIFDRIIKCVNGKVISSENTSQDINI